MRGKTSWGSVSWCRLNARGAHRKPLAEVILWSTPLRATSSANTLSNRYAVRNLIKIKAYEMRGLVGIARQGERITKTCTTQKMGQTWLLKKTEVKIF
jgi:hypothetical protein